MQQACARRSVITMHQSAIEWILGYPRSRDALCPISPLLGRCLIFGMYREGMLRLMLIFSERQYKWDGR
jgi:hypothetical protein